MHWTTTRDGVRLALEVVGPPDLPGVLLAHEFGGDMRSWDGVLDWLGSRRRCVRYAARGFHPSDAPARAAAYGQDRAVSDMAHIARTVFGETPFHLVGCSMGAHTALLFALANPRRVLSLTLIGCSSGPATPSQARRYRRALARELDLLDRLGGRGAVAWFSADAAYRRMRVKRPRLWRAYLARLRAQSVAGAAGVLRTVHWRRRSLWGMRRRIEAFDRPTLLLHGGEDHPLVGTTNRMLAARMPAARAISPARTGHLVHLEEPDLFEAAFKRHLDDAEAAARTVRGHRSPS